MATDFFAQRPAVTPTIYVYNLPQVTTHKGYVKVGYTDLGAVLVEVVSSRLYRREYVHVIKIEKEKKYIKESYEKRYFGFAKCSACDTFFYIDGKKFSGNLVFVEKNMTDFGRNWRLNGFRF